MDEDISPDISSYLYLDNRLSEELNLDATFHDIEDFVLSSPPQKKRRKGKIYEGFKLFDLNYVTKELNNLGWIRNNLLK